MATVAVLGDLDSIWALSSAFEITLQLRNCQEAKKVRN